MSPQAPAAAPLPAAEVTGAASLDAGIPMLLLPVRIETRFDLSDPRQKRLRVRVYPDDVHADSHAPGLETREADLGRAFWQAAWPASSTLDQQRADFGRLAALLGPFRAAWVLEATRPSNWDTRARTPTPQFPVPAKRNTVAPAKARLLPDHWSVAGYQNNELMFSARGAAIPRDLSVAPDFAATGKAPKSIAELIAAQGLSWLRDFDAAATAGMALTIDLPRQGLDLDRGLELVVVGVRSGEKPVDVARQLADLLAAHHWTRGLDFVRRGTPTNNSDDTASGLSTSDPDLAALLDSVLTRTRTPGSASVALYRRAFADASRTVLGLANGTLLERVPLREDAQLDLAGAMNAALWPATVGHFLRRMLPGALTDEWIAWARSHFVARVRGGGALPALRLGNEPYGMLPVALEERRNAANDKFQSAENVLLDLLPAWEDAALKRVAHLDPDATDAAGAQAAGTDSLTDATTALARVLGATPNPADLMVRPVTDQTDVYELRWGLHIFLLDLALVPFSDIATKLGADLAAAKTLERQIAVLEGLVSSGSPGTGYPQGALWLQAHLSSNTEDTRKSAQAAIDYIKDYMLALLYNHRDRSAPLLALKPARTAVTAVMADDSDPALFFSLFGEDTERAGWAAPLVAGDAGATDEVRAWLDALLAEARGGGVQATAPGAHAPLLFQLLKRAIAMVHADDRADFMSGLETLAVAARDGRLKDVAGDLETLMGETLGTSMYRLDAWLSATAAKRIEDARAKKPLGLHIGAYGWVENLRTRAAAPSQGYFHAPSLDHAASGAILRSGWSALGDGVAGVDVSSARVRAAEWLIDGLRDGRGLTELLGQSLERRLHDERLDAQVEPLRRAVLDATGARGAPATGIVDGLVVARAWRGADEVAPLTAEETTVRTALTTLVTTTAALRPVLDAHTQDLDAVADTTLAQAVHAIVRGDTARAAAALSGVGSGDAAPAELTALRTPRGGRRITHRVLMLFDSAATVKTPSPDAIAEPAVEAWLAATLPPLTQVVYGAWVEENGKRTWTGPLALADAGLGWLELLEDLSEGDGPGRLGRRLEWRTARAAAATRRRVTVTLDATAGGRASTGQLPLSLFVAAAQRLRGVLHGGRAADASDLAISEVASTADAAATAARETALNTAAKADLAKLRSAVDAKAKTADMLDACAALARWHVAGTPPSSGLSDLASGADAADREALLAEANDLLARFAKRVAARDAVAGKDLEASLARIRALLGPAALVLPPFAPPDPASIKASAAQSAARLGGAATTFRWLQQAGRVRARVGAAADAIDLVEAAADTARFKPTLVQLPHFAAEGWAANTLPATGSAPRTCVLALGGPPLTAPPARVAGLFVDGWTEVIPDTQVATGIAVHFDSPSAKPPQAFLLAAPPSSGGWTLDGVRSLARQTLTRARQRAVGPDELQGYGQFLPAVYLGDTVDPGEAAP